MNNKNNTKYVDKNNKNNTYNLKILPGTVNITKIFKKKQSHMDIWTVLTVRKNYKLKKFISSFLNKKNI